MPTAAIIGAGLPIACGAAMAARARGTDRIAVSIFGDGSANIGAFHESLNFAAIQQAAGGLRLREQSLWRIQPHPA